MMSNSNFKVNDSVELYSSFEASLEMNFEDSANELFAQYKQYEIDHKLTDSDRIYILIYLSDISNQIDAIKFIMEELIQTCFCFFLGQSPASGGKIVVQSYHIMGNIHKKMTTEKDQMFSHGVYNSYYGSYLPCKKGSSEKQTEIMFDKLDNILIKNSMNIADNVMRTWIYTRDVDNNYAGMVDVRAEIFLKNGMTKDTHYITSTGIEAEGEDTNQLVFMYALSIDNISKDQVTFISAPDYLNPTYEYGVTFERGTRIIYGDRSHYYISGTASIDNLGNVLYPGNVTRQAERALVNIQALLEGYNAKLSDIKSAIVYLRDFSDYKVVKEIVDSKLKHELSIVFVKGSVCRPSWLVEIECIAVNNNFDVRFGAYL
jgi:enamine deaminase RidA (YjgF/YER057c/UK114 family)